MTTYKPTYEKLESLTRKVVKGANAVPETYITDADFTSMSNDEINNEIEKRANYRAYFAVQELMDEIESKAYDNAKARIAPIIDMIRVQYNDILKSGKHLQIFDGYDTISDYVYNGGDDVEQSQEEA